MKIKKLLSLVVLASLVLSSVALAQTAHLTGTVVAVSSTTITLQKGDIVWEIKRSSDTKVSGDAKVGSTVTVTYNAPDAQKKEDPLSAPSPSAAER